MATINHDKTRIAMLGHKRIPSREGGVEIVVEELAVRMARQGFQVTCYNRKGHHIGGKEFDSAEQKFYHGVRLKTVPTIDRKGLSAITASFFAAVCATFDKYDVVHFHAEGPCAMLWLPKLFGKRCIATVHGLDHQRAKWGKIAKAYIMLGERCMARYANEIIVLSKTAQDYFWKTYGRKTIVIPNGVTRPTTYQAEKIKAFGLEKDKYILYLGRIVPEKGIQYLIEAFRNIHTDKKLVIAGGASDTESFMRELQFMAGDNNRIIFTGFVQGRLLAELYSNAYLYILPSDVEGMPLSLLEAMSYGNCCLTSDIPECTEVVEDKAVLFRKSDADDLREKLQELLDHPQMVDRYRKSAASFICEKYNWDDVTQKTLALYQKKMNKGERRHA